MTPMSMTYHHSVMSALEREADAERRARTATSHRSTRTGEPLRIVSVLRAPAAPTV